MNELLTGELNTSVDQHVKSTDKEDASKKQRKQKESQVVKILRQ